MYVLIDLYDVLIKLLQYGELLFAFLHNAGSNFVIAWFIFIP